MLRGLTTTNFLAADMAAATAWYAELFGAPPYFDRTIDGTDATPSAYVEWRLGDSQHEFGILNAAFSPHEVTGAVGGAIAYWAVDDAHAAYDRLLVLGATPHQAPTDRGPGFTTASVVDPFGNILGVMFNQHYLDVVAARDSMAG